MKIKKFIKLGLVICLFLIFNNLIFAANTGKIVGKVTDKRTGEPLVGANVVVEGTNLGIATDSDGRFMILQVPPGEYSVKATYIGYHPLTVTGLEIRPDLTSNVDFELTPLAIETESVVVSANQKMVRSDITSTRESITSDDLENTPGIESVSDIFQSQGGMIMDDQVGQLDLGNNITMEVRDPSLRGISVRGFSGGDALIMIDGVPVSHPVYGGFNLMDLNVEDIKNVEIIKGAFSAQYGQTQSAVINIITKSGGSNYHGGIKYRTDALGIWGPSYGEHRASVNLSGVEPITGQLLPKIGLDIPGKINFYISTTLDVTNTPYNNNMERDALFVLPSYIGDSSQLLKEKQNNKGNNNLKLTYEITSNIKTILTYRNNWRRWTSYKRSWTEYPNHMADYVRDNSSLVWQINHTLSNKTFYNFDISIIEGSYLHSYNNMDPSDFWIINSDTIYSVAEQIQIDPLTGFYDENSYETPWREEYNKKYSASFDFTSQVFDEHMIKLGASLDYSELNNIYISGGARSLSSYGKYIYEDGDEYPAPPGPYKEFGQRRWIINGYPMEGGMYITDKFEKESLVINAGLRMEWIRPGTPTNKDIWKEQWESVTGLKADWPSIKYQVMPRLGVSFPISTNTGIFFSYGHYSKRPGIDDYIRDPYSGGFTGNPHLDFEKSVKFEFGFSHEFPKKWAIDIKNYNNETSGQVGSISINPEYSGIGIQLHDNTGYARSRGLEFTLRKDKTNYFSGRLTYTLQWVKGYSSSKFDDYRRSQNNFPNPITERRLGWDVRHQFVWNWTFRVGQNEHLNLFGLTLPDNWSASILTNLRSGRPYTPGTHSASESRKLYNTETKPPRYRTDIKLEKIFLVKDYKISFGVDIDNIFNNFNTGLKDFNSWTGEPYTYGDHIEDTAQMYDYFQIFRMLSPDRFGEGRHVEIVTSISF